MWILINWTFFHHRVCSRGWSGLVLKHTGSSEIASWNRHTGQCNHHLWTAAIMKRDCVNEIFANAESMSKFSPLLSCRIFSFLSFQNLSTITSFLGYPSNTHRGILTSFSLIGNRFSRLFAEVISRLTLSQLPGDVARGILGTPAFE